MINTGTHHQVRCRLRNLSLASILLLTFSNILLTIRLLNNSEIRASSEQTLAAAQISNQNDHVVVAREKLEKLENCIPQQAIQELEDTTKKETVYMDNFFQSNGSNFLKNFDLNLGRWDATRMYKLYDNVIIGQKYISLSQTYNVCLATQSSLERLSSLVQVAFQWSGPISVGLFAAGDEELNILLLYLYYLQKCFTQIHDRVLFHLAYPKDRAPTRININFTYLSVLDCTNPDLTLKFLLKQRTPNTIKWRTRNPYPQNHLRNLARKNCQTDNVFLTDIDIIPSYGLAEGLNQFLKIAQCKNNLCAYVIPTFELDERVSFPTNKSDLLRLVSKGLARPFHEKIFIYNQFASNISKWQEHTDMINENGKQDVHISHEVTNFEFFYEPFYVAPDTAPLHDERFLGYGFTRNTQVYEMFVRGFVFYVLSPVFTCHWGLQQKKSRPHWRERQNSLNAKQFETFKREIFAKYNKDPLNMMKKSLKQAPKKKKG
ncbi:beta-1,4-glucuronyltransferase 1 [Chrysoperla carnea]|uniref:beta-1,4-glucuronyltransferase 1 n=1 Tax=Chrysoperla carnea TaxID=189513 RepID=UPI001D06DE9C|nr:beta-1,4-glucuronyltransferase 1 [Chrysoperla carnea]XP_044730532.1 beta-1,4-glucuronyltransferase 1 [Chrysoperla carnea]